MWEEGRKETLASVLGRSDVWSRPPRKLRFWQKSKLVFVVCVFVVLVVLAVIFLGYLKDREFLRMSKRPSWSYSQLESVCGYQKWTVMGVGPEGREIVFHLFNGQRVEMLALPEDNTMVPEDIRPGKKIRFDCTPLDGKNFAKRSIRIVQISEQLVQ